MRKSSLCRIAVAIAALPCPVAAQMLPERSDVAGSRPQPDYDPLGIRVGPWTISPQLKVTAGYVSNLYGARRDRPPGTRTSDGFVVYTPSLRARSGWSRHALDISASGTLTRYQHNPRQNTNEYNVLAQGRIDIGARDKLMPSVTATRVAEQRGTSGVPLTFGRPSLDRDILANLEGQHQFGRFSLSATVTHGDERFTNIRLTDGIDESQRFRNSTSNGGSIRLAYRFTPDTSTFVSIGSAHAHTQRIGGRSSDRVVVVAGIIADIGLLRGRLTAGYLRQNFDNPAFRDYSGVTYKGTIFWYPTPLLTVELNATRDLQNSGIFNVGALVTATESADFTYELMRNLLVHATVRRRSDHYREIATRSTLTSGQLSIDYSLNRNVLMGGYGRYECRDSSAPRYVRSYCAFLGGMSLGVRQ